MAQHIPIEAFKQKQMLKIAEQIKKDFKKYGQKTSFKYNWDKSLSDFYRKNETEEVYLATRTIPRGIVFGTNKGDFEIHYDYKNKNINAIYLVA